MTASMTITGADERTPLDDLVRLTTQWPWLEIGLLYSATPDGRNRYPGWGWLVDAASALSRRCSLHVCGRGARTKLLEAQLGDVTRNVARIQVNGVLSIATLRAICSVYCGHTVITQDRRDNLDLRLARVLLNHVLLVDGSGGRGISPSGWLRPVTWKRVGFAGGLGPENLVAELPKIASVALPVFGHWWIDMENNLRTDDWFDLAKARRAVELFSEFKERHNV